ncbi:hypothetical protein DL991_40865 [Amycolatopsis sp. WAC 01375]|nr:hypothetical protein DL991_40865 [Amycolatopsis sp. WAC 01375]
MIMGRVEDFAVAADVHGHQVIRPTIVIPAESPQQLGQLAFGWIQAEIADMLIAKVVREQRDYLIACRR